jgi:acetoin utilization deacetylase AcuC-like enzyme
MAKYRLLREIVEASPRIPSDRIHQSPRAERGELLLVHDSSYLEQLECGSLTAQAQRRIGFPWSPKLVERSYRSVGGTLAACRAALAEGLGINLAGGTHHAFRDRGEGFCILNDAAVAARVSQQSWETKTVLIFDADVHQGNGTAAIFAGDPTVFTCSIHGRRNFPYRKETSDLDVELEDRTEDDEYLDVIARTLASLESRLHPDLVIYLAGVDPYVGDRWGRLAISARGLARRDRQVIQHFRGRQIPLVIVMAGGYAEDPRKIASLHLQTVEIAAQS